MTAAELLDTWQDEVVNNLPGQKEIVAAMIVHDAHPNVILDFGYLLFMAHGIPAIIELKELVNKEYERSY